MIVLKNLKNKITEILTASSLLTGFEIEANPFISKSLSEKDSIFKGIYVYSMDADVEIRSRTQQGYSITGELMIEIVLISSKEEATLLDDLSDHCENVIGLIELEKFIVSGTKENKILNGACASLNLKKFTLTQDCQSEGFAAKALIKYEFLALHKFTPVTPTEELEEINLELEESSYNDFVRRVAGDDLRIL